MATGLEPLLNEENPENPNPATNTDFILVNSHNQESEPKTVEQIIQHYSISPQHARILQKAMMKRSHMAEPSANNGDTMQQGPFNGEGGNINRPLFQTPSNTPDQRNPTLDNQRQAVLLPPQTEPPVY